MINFCLLNSKQDSGTYRVSSLVVSLSDECALLDQQKGSPSSHALFWQKLSAWDKTAIEMAQHMSKLEITPGSAYSGKPLELTQEQLNC